MRHPQRDLQQFKMQSQLEISETANLMIKQSHYSIQK